MWGALNHGEPLTAFGQAHRPLDGRDHSGSPCSAHRWTWLLRTTGAPCEQGRGALLLSSASRDQGKQPASVVREAIAAMGAKTPRLTLTLNANCLG